MRGLIELFVVLAFVIGWCVIELFILRYDRLRARRSADAAPAGEEAKTSEQSQRARDAEPQERLHPP